MDWTTVINAAGIILTIVVAEEKGLLAFAAACFGFSLGLGLF